MIDAEPARDSNPTFGLEQHGFDFIPETERKMTLRDLAYVWLGANACLFFFSVGVIAFSLGLNVWEALLAVVVGNALFAYVAWGSIAVQSLPHKGFRRRAPAGPFPGRAASLLPGSLVITRTGLSPAGDDELLIRS
jgi:Permease for cytosine/purines, uracil, thiamine, allantoin